MKKSILTLLLALVAAPAVHANTNVNIVCGDKAVSIRANDANEFDSIVVDGVVYSALANLDRKVEHGQLMTYMQAGSLKTGEAVTVRVSERGEILANVYGDKLKWQTTCREAAY